MSATVSNFYVTGGTLRQDAPSYVERKADRELYEGLLAGEFCYVLTSRQMGKSSLMVHTAARLKEQGVAVVVLDLTAIGQNLSPEQWYGGLLRRLGRQLDREDELESFWLEQEQRGPLERWMAALEQVVLPAVGVGPQGAPPRSGGHGVRGDCHSPVPDAQRPTPNAPRLVIFIDEIDAVRSLPFSTDEFFAGIRECYNRRTQDPQFERLTFCLLGVASPSDLIRDTRTTPFNIGRRIELTDFTPAEAAPLAAGLAERTPPPTPPLQGEGSPTPSSTPPLQGEGSPTPPSLAGKGAGGLGPAQQLLQRILYWTGGHPYLTQRLCQAAAQALSQDPNPQSRVHSRGALRLPSSAQTLPPSPGDTAPNPPSVDRLCETLFLSSQAQERDDNLLFVRERLLKSEADRASLLDLYSQVRRGKQVRLDDTNQLVTILRLSGIVRAAESRSFRSSGPQVFRSSAVLRVRNRIYARVFDRQWVTTHMPDAELRRQREAFRRGVRRTAAAAALIVAMVGRLGLTAVQQARRARRTARAEARQRQIAEAQRLAARRNLYAAQVNLAEQTEEQGNVERAQALLEALRPEEGQEDLRGFEWRYLWRLCQGDARDTWLGHSSFVNDVKYSPDGRLLAAAAGDTITLRDKSTGRSVGALKVPQPEIIAIDFSPDGKRLAAVGDDALVHLWDVDRRRPIAALRGHAAGMRVHAVAFSPDGKWIASESWDRTVRLWQVAGPDGQPRAFAALPVSSSYWHALAWSPDSRLLAIGTRPGPVQLWSIASRRPVATLAGHTIPVQCVAFSPDAKLLASGGPDDTVRLWELTHKPKVGARPVAILGGHGASVAALAFSPDSKILASGGEDRTIKLWDMATRRELTTFRGHKDVVAALAFSPDGKTLASASGDQTVKLWDSTTREATSALRAGMPVTALAFSADGRSLATAGSSGGVRIWEATSRRLQAGWKGHPQEIGTLAFSPDGKLLATGSRDGAVRFWSSPSGRAAGMLPKPAGPLMEVAFSPDGQRVVTCHPGSVRLWDAATHRVLTSLQWNGGWGGGIALSPDRRTLVALTGSGTMTLYDLVTRRITATLSSGAFPPARFSPDGRILAVRSPSGVQLWDMAQRQWAAVLKGTTEGGGDLAFSPDGKILATVSGHTVTLWNLTIRQEVVTLRGHSGPVTAVAFAPDGSTLASASLDGTVRLWHAATLQETDPLQVTALAGDRSVTLRWRPVRWAQGYNVYRLSGEHGSLVRLNPQPLAGGTFIDQGPELVNGRPVGYLVAAVSRGAGGPAVEMRGPLGRAVLSAVPIGPAEGYLGCSMGEGDRPGSVQHDRASGAIVLRGAGAGFTGEADAGYFLNRPVTGDFQLTARLLAEPSGPRVPAQAGLMLREALVPGARQAALLVSQKELGILFQWRPVAGEGILGDAYVNQYMMRLPLTLRLTRQGSTIRPEYSLDDGRHFWRAGTPLFFPSPLPPVLYAGLSISSHDASRSAAVRFDRLEIRSIGPDSAPAPAPVDRIWVQDAEAPALAASGGNGWVRLQWHRVPGAVGYRIERLDPGPGGERGVRLARLPAAQTEFTDRGPGLVNGQPRTYSVAALLARPGGAIVDGPPGTVAGIPVAAPPGFAGSSINEGPRTGSVTVDAGSGVIALRGSGADLMDRADGGYFLHRAVTGDFQLTVQMLTRPQGGTHPHTKGGLMIRESLDPSSRDAYLIVHRALAGLCFQWRDFPGDIADGTAPVFPAGALKLPIWLRLTRRGSTISAAYSTDGGRSFRPAGAPRRYDPPFPRSLEAGLAITAHTEGEISEAKFRDLRIERQ